MKKNIKDYLPFYTGCRISTPYGECKFLYYKFDIDDRRYNPVLVDRGDNHFAFRLEEVKLILRPLSSMTKEEKREWLDNCGETLNKFNAHEYKCNRAICDSFSAKWLIDKHFDVFNLIPEGLAIDATTLKTEE